MSGTKGGGRANPRSLPCGLTSCPEVLCGHQGRGRGRAIPGVLGLVCGALVTLDKPWLLPPCPLCPARAAFPICSARCRLPILHERPEGIPGKAVNSGPAVVHG